MTPAVVVKRPRLTPVDKRIFEFICDYMEQSSGRAPSLREIAQGCGLKSPTTALYHVNKLVQLGKIYPNSDTKRGIQVVGARWIRPPAET